MKLAVAVLSSILFACSITTANPVDPNESTDAEHRIFTGTPTVLKGVEYNFWIDANPDGIGLGALDDALSDNVKHLLDKYVELQDGRNQQRKIYWPLKSRYDSQYDVVVGVKKDLKVLEYLSQDDDSLKYYIEIRKTKLDHEKQLSKLDKIRKSFYECQFKIGLLVEKKSETDERIVSLILGTPLDVVTVIYKSSLIRGTPSVKDYLEQQSSKYESLGQNPIDQEYQNPSDQQRQDLQSSLDTLSGSGSFEQKVPSNKRQGFSKFMSRLGSFFGRPKREDREPLI
ncbi:hypothetical protein BATDEDRAFT_24768 [Batrachochytrium dendrobatidis JAM81]|uniref:Uncharacterized protein n=1 Tax=Batrachochytrium dendrobatidis (strain JAM81 / FGSC 10211) TaxID=684364 RepID=F4P2C0_BATDJ|nr:uncharacterized protein BATDEDRAFT_24768 [Batrachochytrium dendrobatidis JAM81]EGF81087.1 hypothetical protein BATDEDRAFT_24768 [Batrachochytrium dendrobatidis JAM81]|eukprot:XP_006678540.1 hypothetical protein BATDEDRAFT_24768 [Batrachochytrium dendrobatidis JAM81]